MSLALHQALEPRPPSRWNTDNHDPNDEGDVCGIRLVPYEGCCPLCKMPVDDCPLSTCLLPREEQGYTPAYTLALPYYFLAPSMVHECMMYHSCFCSLGRVQPHFIFIVYSSGSVPLRPSSNGQWTIGHGVRMSVSPSS